MSPIYNTALAIRIDLCCFFAAFLLMLAGTFYFSLSCCVQLQYPSPMEFARQVYSGNASEEKRPGSPDLFSLVERAEKVSYFFIRTISREIALLKVTSNETLTFLSVHL
jgi:hypothetical protein